MGRPGLPVAASRTSRASRVVSTVRVLSSQVRKNPPFMPPPPVASNFFTCPDDGQITPVYSPLSLPRKAIDSPEGDHAGGEWHTGQLLPRALRTMGRSIWPEG